MTTAADNQRVWIDGAFGEGGGQILRTSVSLAALTGKTVEIANIRARRSKPGLQAQHLTSVRAAAALCNATLHGDDLGSSFLRFLPGAPVPHAHFDIDVAAARGGASAGATGLVAQTMLVPMAFLPGPMTSATILGGTHVPMAPPTDYIEAVYAPMLRRMGIEARLTYTRAGFYPRGGGAIHLEVQAGRPGTPVDCTERGKLKRLRVFLVTSQLPDHVAARGREAALKGLAGYGVEVAVEARDLPSHGAGAAVVIAAECEIGMGGWTSLGERGKPMERVVEEAVREFKHWFASGAGVDAHLADQLALPCALIPQESRWTTPEITEHLRTVLWVAQQFLPIEYALEPRPDGSGLVTVRGVALPAR
jgi:RNA 3'-terminal phosphate cyclase (ATP)